VAAMRLLSFVGDAIPGFRKQRERTQAEAIAPEASAR